MIWALLFACNGDKGDTALDTANADTGPTPNPLANVDWLEDQLVLNIQHGEGYDFTLESSKAQTVVNKTIPMDVGRPKIVVKTHGVPSMDCSHGGRIAIPLEIPVCPLITERVSRMPSTGQYL